MAAPSVWSICVVVMPLSTLPVSKTHRPCGPTCRARTARRAGRSIDDVARLHAGGAEHPAVGDDGRLVDVARAAVRGRVRPAALAGAQLVEAPAGEDARGGRGAQERADVSGDHGPDRSTNKSREP